MNLHFLKLTDAQRRAFKTKKGLLKHGPLTDGQRIDDCRHDTDAIYVVSAGMAYFGSGRVEAVIGHRTGEYDAVVVPAGTYHRWQSYMANTVIEHALSSEHVARILAA